MRQVIGGLSAAMFRRVLLGGLLLLAGCNVVSSTREFVRYQDGEVRQKCESGLGSYSLAYTTVSVEVYRFFTTAATDDGKVPGVPTGSPTVSITSGKHHPDNQHIYCLNYLEASSAHDVVSVLYGDSNDKAGLQTAGGFNLTTDKRNEVNPNGLLASVISRNIDETGTIIRKIIRALFVLISGNGSAYDAGRALTVPDDKTDLRKQVSLEFDPFDRADMVMVNRRLHEYGVCITMGDYSYDTRSRSPSQFCEHPEYVHSPQYGSQLLARAEKQTFKVKHLPQGIYYRPRQSYPLYVYMKDDPGYPGEWKLRKTTYVSLENLSPVLSLGITRAMFAEKRIIMAFDNGNLLDVCLLKGSEVQGAIEVPLEIIFGAIALPGNVLKAQFELANGTNNLLTAQNALIAAQNNYIKYLADPEKNKVSNAPTVLPKNAAADNRPSFAAPISGPKGDGKDNTNNPIVSLPKVAEPDNYGFCDRLKDTNITALGNR